MEKKELRGSGSKERVGRKPITYEKKTLSKKNVPLEIYDLCKLLVDLEVSNWRLKNTNQQVLEDKEVRNYAKIRSNTTIKKVKS